MVFGKKRVDISKDEKSFLLDCISKIFQDNNLNAAVENTLQALDLKIACVLSLSHDTQLHVIASSAATLRGAKGVNTLLLKTIQENTLVIESQADTIFGGLVESSVAEDIQYKKHIKYFILIPSGKYLLIAGSEIELSEHVQTTLSQLVRYISMYQDKVTNTSENDKMLRRENLLLKALQIFTNIAITKNNSEDIAEFAVNQIAEDLDYAYINVVLKEGDKWHVIAINETPIIKKIEEMLGTPYKTHYLSAQEAASNVAISKVMNRQIHKTTELKDILYPWLDTAFIELIKPILQVKLMYVFPLTNDAEILGEIVYLIKKDTIDAYEENVLRSYAYQLGVILSNAKNIETVQHSKESLQSAYDKLEQTNREKDNLMSMASHELRTPATVARNAIDLINQYNTLTDPNIKEKFEMINEAIGRELTIINTMLEVSRIDTKKLELVYQNVDMEHLIHMSVEEMRFEAEKKGLQLSYVKENSPLPQIKADNTRLREVIDNLLTNAIKYTDHGSITVTSKINANTIEVSVADTGKGISEAVQGSLFQMFHRITDNPTPTSYAQSHQGGLGLGLYITRNIIEAHKGSIHVQSKENEGSTFTFLIPITN